MKLVVWPDFPNTPKLRGTVHGWDGSVRSRKLELARFCVGLSLIHDEKKAQPGRAEKTQTRAGVGERPHVWRWGYGVGRKVN